MKKIIIILSLLVVVFIGVWTAKLKTPMDANDPYANGLSEESPWWEVLPEGTWPTPDDEWVLDPEIPDNYIPVLNGDELYMVVDDDGNIVRYRQRIRQEDGSWLWQDVDPNIPQDFVPVEGLENVYMTTDDDGTVRYYRYTRNADDTFFFTEVDAEGNPLPEEQPAADEIPPNFIRVSGNIYAIYNEHGVLIGYKERVLREDGTYAWVECDAPSDTGQNSGRIPGVSVEPSGGGTGDIYIVAGDGGEEKTGYQETNTYTETKQEDGWTIVYETIVTRVYDLEGNLISTKKDGPTEINRFPTTAINSEILPPAD